jgi:hypothetical protein
MLRMLRNYVLHINFVLLKSNEMVDKKNKNKSLKILRNNRKQIKIELHLLPTEGDPKT